MAVFLFVCVPSVPTNQNKKAAAGERMKVSVKTRRSSAEWEGEWEQANSEYRETGKLRETDTGKKRRGGAKGEEALPVSVWSTAKCTVQSDGNAVCTPVLTSWPTVPVSVEASPQDTPTHSPRWGRLSGGWVDGE